MRKYIIGLLLLLLCSTTSLAIYAPIRSTDMEILMKKLGYDLKKDYRTMDPPLDEVLLKIVRRIEKLEAK